jgi:hypothetical protein
MARPRKEPVQIQPEADSGIAESLQVAQREAANHSLAVQEATGQVVPYNRVETVTRIRGLMEVGARVMLELGEQLIILRENEPEADFREVMERLGMDTRTAYRCMQASRKFRLGMNPDQQAALENLSRGKMYELLVLDDEEVKELADGGTVAGLNLDEIDTMSTSELRRTLRQERAKINADLETKDRQIQAKNEQIDKLDGKLDKLTHGGKAQEARLTAEREANAVKAFQDAALELLGAIQKFDLAVADCLVEQTESRVTLAEQTVTWAFQRIAEIASTRGMAVDFQAIVDPLSLSAEA